MIIIALGANLPSGHGSPLETLQAAVRVIDGASINVTKASRVWLTAPVPFDPDQDWYHNAVIAVETDLTPQALLENLITIEERFGRVRSVKNAPRVLDLDIIAYNDEVIEEGERLILPHQRMHERLFVLKPIEDIAPEWSHPKLNLTIDEMLDKYVDTDQKAQVLEDTLL